MKIVAITIMFAQKRNYNNCALLTMDIIEPPQFWVVPWRKRSHFFVEPYCNSKFPEVSSPTKFQTVIIIDPYRHFYHGSIINLLRLCAIGGEIACGDVKGPYFTLFIFIAIVIFA